MSEIIYPATLEEALVDIDRLRARIEEEQKWRKQVTSDAEHTTKALREAEKELARLRKDKK